MTKIVQFPNLKDQGTNMSPTFISPMLAAPPSKLPQRIESGVWALEEKFDGHRLVISVASGQVTAWSRYGNEQVLPPHLFRELRHLPTGIYDGELMSPTRKCYGVKALAYVNDLQFVVFDILQLLGNSLLQQTYDTRRLYLEEIFKSVKWEDCLVMSTMWPVDSIEEVQTVVEGIWKREGEGAILKRRASVYTPGKRPKDSWVKIKRCESAVLTVVGFLPSEGEINDRGPYAIVVLRDDEGGMTQVKTKNDAELRRFEREAMLVERYTQPGSAVRLVSAAPGRQPSLLPPSGPEPEDSLSHPAIGRRLRIEYQERTSDGSYREPRWDRWEDE